MLTYRGSLIATTYGLPIDFAVATTDTDDRQVLLLLCVSLFLLSLETKGIFQRNLRNNSLGYTMCVYYRHGAVIRKNNIRSRFGNYINRYGGASRLRSVDFQISSIFHAYALKHIGDFGRV